MKPTFTTKEEYLKWRTEWRVRYAEISRDIRSLKLARRALASGLGRPQWAAHREHIAATIKRFSTFQEGFFQPWFLMKLQAKAREMLAWRKESKILAQEQYLKAHPSPIVS